MVGTPNLGKRVKKETVSEEDKETGAEETDFTQEETQRGGKLWEKERDLMKKCQRAIKHYKEEERVREIRNGIESQIRNDSRRLWKWIGRQLYQEKNRKAMVIKKGFYKW